MAGREWSYSDRQAISTYQHLGIPALARMLGRTEAAVKMQMSRMGLLGDEAQEWFVCPLCGMHSHSTASTGPGKVQVQSLSNEKLVSLREVGKREYGHYTVRQALEDPVLGDYTENFLRLLVRLGREAQQLLRE